jgi:hypothetical protein
MYRYQLSLVANPLALSSEIFFRDTDSFVSTWIFMQLTFFLTADSTEGKALGHIYIYIKLYDHEGMYCSCKKEPHL